ncbi:hypothetical protein PMAYCL1PPCAC_06203, partial [Pristionchus mayeri]
EYPTMTTEKIRDALFPGDPRMPLKEIFEYNEGEMRLLTDQTKKDRNSEMNRIIVEGMLLGTQTRLLQEGNKDDGQLETVRKMKEILSGEGANIVRVREETEPVLVGNIPYFWGEANLPEGNNETDYVDVSPVNDASNITIRKVLSLIRCHKSLSDVVIVGKRAKSFLDRRFSWDYSADKMVDVKIEIKNGDGLTREQFSWFCPSSDRCCEWECCSTVEKEYTDYAPPDKNVRFAVRFVIFMVIIILVILSIAICCKSFEKKKEERRKERREQREEIERREAAPLRQRQQQMRERRRDEEERQPQTTPYPMEPSTFPTVGSYGWSLI